MSQRQTRQVCVSRAPAALCGAPANATSPVVVKLRIDGGVLRGGVIDEGTTHVRFEMPVAGAGCRSAVHGVHTAP